MCMCVGVKNRIVTCENCVLVVKKGISEFWGSVAQKQPTKNKISIWFSMKKSCFWYKII